MRLTGKESSKHDVKTPEGESEIDEPRSIRDALFGPGNLNRHHEQSRCW